MKWISVRDVKRGMTIELTGAQTLWDTSTSPWRALGAGSRLAVMQVRRMPTGRTDRQPFELTLQDLDGGVILQLEVSDGQQLILTDEESHD